MKPQAQSDDRVADFTKPVWILAKTDSFDKDRILVGLEQVSPPCVHLFAVAQCRADKF